MAQAEYDQLAAGLPHDRYLAQVGAYQAARRAVDLIDTILEKAQADHDRTDTTQQHARDHRQFVTYGTPYWKP